MENEKSGAELFDTCESREDFIHLLKAMRGDLETAIAKASEEELAWDVLPDTYWNKTDIVSFLDVLINWLPDRADDYFQRNHNGWPENPWTMIGEIFMAGAVRE